MKHTVLLSGILTVFVIIFFSSVFFGKEVFYCCDNFNMTIPNRLFLVDTIRAFGQIPLWNPHLFSGIPFFADISIGMLDPRTFFYFITTPFRALTLEILSHMLVLFLGMLWMVRKVFRLSWRASLFGTIVFSFSAVVIGSFHNVVVLRPLSFIPWVFGSIYLSVTRPTKKRIRFAILAVAVQAIAGHPQVTYLTILFSSFAILVESTVPFWKRIGIVTAVVIIGILFTGIQLIPFLEFAATATRNFLDRSYQVFGAMPPWVIVRFVFPEIVGKTLNNTALFLQGNREGYIGIIPLLLLVFVPFKKPVLKFFLISAVLSVCLSFGDALPVHRIFSLLIPGFSKFRMPSFALIFYSFSLSILTAYGFHHLRLLQEKEKRIFTAIGMSVVAIGIITSMLSMFTPYIATSVSMIPAKLVTKFSFPDALPLMGILKDVSFNLFFVGFTIGVCIKVLSGKTMKHSTPIIVLVMLCIDLLLFVKPIMRLEKESSVMSFISEAQIPSDFDISKWRITVDPNSHDAGRGKTYGISNEYEEEMWQARILRQNVGLYMGISYIEGYGPMVPYWYQTYFDSRKFAPTGVVIPEPRDINTSSVSAALLVRRSPDTEKVEFVSIDGARPRFFLWDGTSINPDGIQVISETPNKIVLEVTSEEPSLLVNLDMWFPGWRATIAGKSTDIIPFEGTFRSVSMPIGTNRVIFQYVPKSLITGAFVSALGIILFLLIPGSVYHLLRRKKNDDSDRIKETERQSGREKRVRKTKALREKRKKTGKRKGTKRKK